ncbi:hypothetical protein LCGC14_0604590 [marine sediment metagenome]|uniref:Uncharacterized protein n=1 Tax=marine sediment metagenome TaxID=412755 RepID=A0A0F9RTH8_9ZZZZ|nr:MAG: hypothetical protein Lokiarch_19930 [Candidatus Lokiarchaeum sp. GC14_75]
MNPINTETYNRTRTFIGYTPTKGKHSTSMEFVQFNEPVILSQKFLILGEIAEEMANIYKASKNGDLMELSYSYNTLAEEIKSISSLVKEQLFEYDWQILESSAVLADYHDPGNGGGGGNFLTCIICIAGCELAVLGGCIIACLVFIPFCPVCVLVVDLWELFDLGCGYVCEWIGAC